MSIACWAFFMDVNLNLVVGLSSSVFSSNCFGQLAE